MVLEGDLVTPDARAKVLELPDDDEEEEEIVEDTGVVDSNTKKRFVGAVCDPEPSHRASKRLETAQRERRRSCSTPEREVRNAQRRVAVRVTRSEGRTQRILPDVPKRRQSALRIPILEPSPLSGREKKKRYGTEETLPFDQNSTPSERSARRRQQSISDLPHSDPIPSRRRSPSGPDFPIPNILDEDRVTPISPLLEDPSPGNEDTKADVDDDVGGSDEDTEVQFEFDSAEKLLAGRVYRHRQDICLSRQAVPDEGLDQLLDSLQRDPFRRSLDLSDNKLTRLPLEAIARNFPWLASLRCEKNALRSIDDQLIKLTYLRTLILSHNEIVEVTETIFELPFLSVLCLNDNLLEALPSEIGRAKNLRVLDLRHNRLSILPVQIARLEQLRILDVSHNLLEELPIGLETQKGLQWVKVDENPVTEKLVSSSKVKKNRPPACEVVRLSARKDYKDFDGTVLLESLEDDEDPFDFDKEI
eukprot:Plantae.Rhodophyta-Rhodochaete_pulchella.ctg2797.p1 GENE.Plantae.Rhodophyta-Rhodochaete_pulchella.ctg2797~~Plantae.Rhodophyta-Rhodochaete_pulchella.ctg2797.p1  ORF type:complete len:499 (+),score=73.00 Plantae.Rhodophyta-Rhodochaete_pulchella.ctg2797:73-1497(+)